MENKFTHLEEYHNLKSPREIVPKIIELFNPKSVVDIGCGIGTFLYCFKENGINDVLGLDGEWVDKKLLGKYLSPDDFQICNLEEELNLERKFDLVVSLEVAEHLSIESAEIYIKNLISLGEVILFSAAIPFQGGSKAQGHINEQWPSYWEKKFLKYNYTMHDILRPMFWNNPEIWCWYRQNMVIVTPKDYKFNTDLVYNSLRDVVHYELYLYKVLEIEELTKKLERLELSNAKLNS